MSETAKDFQHGLKIGVTWGAVIGGLSGLVQGLAATGIIVLAGAAVAPPLIGGALLVAWLLPTLYGAVGGGVIGGLIGGAIGAITGMAKDHAQHVELERETIKYREMRSAARAQSVQQEADVPPEQDNPSRRFRDMARPSGEPALER